MLTCWHIFRTLFIVSSSAVLFVWCSGFAIGVVGVVVVGVGFTAVEFGVVWGFVCWRMEVWWLSSVLKVLLLSFLESAV